MREVAMVAAGIPAERTNRTGLSESLALAGSLYAINYGFVNPSITEPARAAEVLVATLLGGPGSVYGPFFGTLAFLGIKDFVSNIMTRWELAVGVLTIIVCFYFEGGVWGTIQTIGSKIRGRFGKQGDTASSAALIRPQRSATFRKNSLFGTRMYARRLRFRTAFHSLSKVSLSLSKSA